MIGGNTLGTVSVYVIKDGITSNTINIEVTAAVIRDITVTPSTMRVAQGQTQQLTATYSDDTSSDVSNSVTWMVLDTATATVTPTGILSGVEIGNTTVIATLDGITSNTVNVDVCNELACETIDIFDTGNGKLFTNSPSVAYLNSIGGSGNNIRSEIETFGPVGDFYQFDWDNANTLCITYSSQNIGGRNNWRLPTKDELYVELFNTYGNMFIARGWPTTYYYWSATAEGVGYYGVTLNNGIVNNLNPIGTTYASCVSSE